MMRSWLRLLSRIRRYEDDVRRAEKELQKATDRFVGEIDEMVQRKEAELLEV